MDNKNLSKLTAWPFIEAKRILKQLNKENFKISLKPLEQLFQLKHSHTILKNTKFLKKSNIIPKLSLVMLSQN